MPVKTKTYTRTIITVWRPEEIRGTIGPAVKECRKELLSRLLAGDLSVAGRRGVRVSREALLDCVKNKIKGMTAAKVSAVRAELGV